MRFNSIKTDDNITLYSLLCLELPLHIDFKNDMLAVSYLLLTARLHCSDTLTFLLSQHPAKLPASHPTGVPHHAASALKQRCQHNVFFVNTLISFNSCQLF
jgi:hypothetical protein